MCSPPPGNQVPVTVLLLECAPLAEAAPVLHPDGMSGAATPDDIVLLHPIDPWVDVVFNIASIATLTARLPNRF